MAQKKQKMLLADLETLVMKEVWKRGRATVHDVRDALRRRRNLAYTTVLTTMRNLERKGFLVHKVEGRSYVYLPKVDQGTVARSTVQDLLDRVFDGSAVRLVNALFEEEQLSKEQFENLRKEILELRRKEDNDG